MTLIHEKTETFFMVLTRELPRFLLFLEAKNFKPNWDGYRTIRVSREVIHHRLVTQWQRHTGYERALKNYLANYRLRYPNRPA
jgi:hypothetical protein